MRELIDEFGRAFDLDYRVDGVSLRELVSATVEQVEDQPLPDWGTKGAAKEVSEAGTPTLRFYYVPHLFPGMDHKLRLAHKLQFHMLPRALPADAPVSLAAVLESYCHLSGDLLGWEPLASGDFLIWILDISGHGVRSGLASTVLKVLIDRKRNRARVDELASYLNEALCACARPEAGALFATGFFLSVRKDGGAVYTSAGHPPAFVRRVGGEVQPLASNSRPLGLFDDSRYARGNIPFEGGDQFVLYTDGLSEIFQERAEQQGVADLEGVVRRYDEPPEKLVASIFRELSSFKRLHELDDDVTYLAGRRVDAARTAAGVTSKRIPAR